MKILFLCKHNRFRSKVAEAIFKKLNKNKNIEAESAGLILDDLRPYIAKKVLKNLREKGYNARGLPRQATRELLNKFDVIVIVADNIDKGFFHDFHGKIIKWNIEDCDEEDFESIKRIIGEIEEKVKKFADDFIL